MRKVERCKVFEALPPESLEEAYNNWISSQCTARDSNVMIKDIPFIDGIRDRSILPVGTNKFAMAIYYTDFELSETERGGPRQHPRQSEGMSAFGGEGRRR